jgi:hypothetical protein
MPWLETLADRLAAAAANPQPVGEFQAVVFSADDIAKTSEQLRKIAAQSRADFQENGPPPTEDQLEELTRVPGKKRRPKDSFGFDGPLRLPGM